MAIILASYLKTHIKDDNDLRRAIALEDTNSILSNIKKYANFDKNAVYVANDPFDYDEAAEKSEIVFTSLRLSGLSFSNYIVLDNKSKDKAAKIINDAGFIYLAGGKVIKQARFFKEIKLKKLLKNHRGLTIGVSAGAMNLCKKIFNFPEEQADLNDPLWIKGMGFYSKVIIPHFDGSTKTYQFTLEQIDVVRDYIMPFSVKQKFIGLPNDAYILLDKKSQSVFGNAYKIQNKTIGVL